LYIEDVGYQKTVIQTLNKQGVNAEGYKVSGRDKRERLESITHMIRNGNVYFPREGGEDLIQQLVYFGVEKHDDLVDAFTMVLHKSLGIKFYEIQIFDREMLGL
jgi:predicted phage terminase large subunit-like protein